MVNKLFINAKPFFFFFFIIVIIVANFTYNLRRVKKADVFWPHENEFFFFLFSIKYHKVEIIKLKQNKKYSDKLLSTTCITRSFLAKNYISFVFLNADLINSFRANNDYRRNFSRSIYIGERKGEGRLFLKDEYSSESTLFWTNL